MQSTKFRVQIKSHAIACVHNLLDCFAMLAMTEVCGAAYPGTEWERILAFSDHPAAARHPSNGGELGTVLYFLLCSINVSHSRACIIYWIATPSAMARNDKRGKWCMYC